MTAEQSLCFFWVSDGWEIGEGCGTWEVREDWVLRAWVIVCQKRNGKEHFLCSLSSIYAQYKQNHRKFCRLSGFPSRHPQVWAFLHVDEPDSWTIWTEILQKWDFPDSRRRTKSEWGSRARAQREITRHDLSWIGNFTLLSKKRVMWNKQEAISVTVRGTWLWLPPLDLLSHHELSRAAFFPPIA